MEGEYEVRNVRPLPLRMWARPGATTILARPTPPGRCWRKPSPGSRAEGQDLPLPPAGSSEATAIHLLKAQDVMTNFGLEFTFLRLNNRQEIEDAMRPNTR